MNNGVIDDSDRQRAPHVNTCFLRMTVLLFSLSVSAYLDEGMQQCVYMPFIPGVVSAMAFFGENRLDASLFAQRIRRSPHL